jgi:hypothetical protein
LRDLLDRGEARRLCLRLAQRAVGLGELGDHVRRALRVDVARRSQRAAERPERRRTGDLRAASHQDTHAERRRAFDQLFGAARLADAGLAGQRAQRSATVDRIAQELAELGQHALTPDERRRDRRRLRGGARRVLQGDIRGEAIAAPMHRLDRRLRGAALAECAADVADAPGDDRFVDELVGPQLVEQLGLADDPPPLLDQVAEDIEHLRLQGQLDVRAAQHEAAGVELIFSERVPDHRTSLSPLMGAREMSERLRPRALTSV